jgi:hypothetical protein
MQIRRALRAIPTILALVLALVPDERAAHADNAVVGTGTPASCTEAAFDAGLAQLFPGEFGPGGTLSFNCGAAPHTIVLSGQKFLHDGATIDGGGLITLSGANASRIFWVSQQARVEIRRITLTHGFAAPGGAIFVEPNWSGDRTTLLLDEVRLLGNRSSSFGGAIGAQHANLLITNSTLHDNQAESGGGISFNAGELIIRDSSITGNRAARVGGGLEVWAARPLLIEASAIDDNVVEGAGADHGGGLLINNSDATLSASSVQRNEAPSGGGIYGQGQSAIAIEASQVSDNMVFRYGGGIMSESTVLLSINTTTMNNNRATGAGGALYNSGYLLLTRSTLMNNAALTSGGGGGLLNSGEAEVSLTTFSSNNAEVGGGIEQRAGAGLTLLNSTLADNYATDQGGGIRNASDRLTIKNTFFAYNVAEVSGSNCALGATAPAISFSLWNDASCGTQAVNGNHPNAGSVGLQYLKMNGGPTMTYGLESFSLAIDAGSCPPGGVDQRGFARVVGAACDIGSVEYGVLWPALYLPVLIR